MEEGVGIGRGIIIEGDQWREIHRGGMSNFLHLLGVLMLVFLIGEGTGRNQEVDEGERTIGETGGITGLVQKVDNF